MTYFSGLDLLKRSVTATTLDAGGALVDEPLEHGHEDELEVEPEAPVLDVVLVVLDLSRVRAGASAEYLVQFLSEPSVRDRDVPLRCFDIVVPGRRRDHERARARLGQLRAVPVPETVGRDGPADPRRFSGLAEGRVEVPTEGGHPA